MPNDHNIQSRPESRAQPPKPAVRTFAASSLPAVLKESLSRQRPNQARPSLQTHLTRNRQQQDPASGEIFLQSALRLLAERTRALAYALAFHPDAAALGPEVRLFRSKVPDQVISLAAQQSTLEDPSTARALSGPHPLAECLITAGPLAGQNLRDLGLFQQGKGEPECVCEKAVFETPKWQDEKGTDLGNEGNLSTNEDARKNRRSMEAGRGKIKIVFPVELTVKNPDEDQKIPYTIKCEVIGDKETGKKGEGQWGGIPATEGALIKRAIDGYTQRKNEDPKDIKADSPQQKALRAWLDWIKTQYDLKTEEEAEKKFEELFGIKKSKKGKVVSTEPKTFPGGIGEDDGYIFHTHQGEVPCKNGKTELVAVFSPAPASVDADGNPTVHSTFYACKAEICGAEQITPHKLRVYKYDDQPAWWKKDHPK